MIIKMELIEVEGPCPADPAGGSEYLPARHECVGGGRVEEFPHGTKQWWTGGLYSRRRPVIAVPIADRLAREAAARMFDFYENEP